MSFKDVLRHIWSVHEGRKCPICFIDTKNRTYFKEHLLNVHGEKLEKKVERPSCRKVLLVNKQDLKDTPKPVHEDKNQKENTNLCQEIIENQGPENVLNKENTKTDIDSSRVHESKKPEEIIKPVKEAKMPGSNCSENLCLFYFTAGENQSDYEEHLFTVHGKKREKKKVTFDITWQDLKLLNSLIYF